MSNWDARWLDLAELVAGWSKDESRKVGAVIVDDRQRVLSLGWNGFPRDIDDEVRERHERPAKYKWTEHAERNAIYNAAANGHRLRGATMYLPWYPCADCARAIIQSGIMNLVCVEPDWTDPVWASDFTIVKTMLWEAGIYARFVADRVAPTQSTSSEGIKLADLFGEVLSVAQSASIQPTIRCSVCRFCEHVGLDTFRCRHHGAVIMEPGYRYECTEGQE